MALTSKADELLKQIAAMKVNKSLFNEKALYDHMEDAFRYGTAIGDPSHNHTMQRAAQNVQRPPDSKFTNVNMRKMIASRMGWDINPIANGSPLTHCEPHKLNDDEAVVFVIHNGKALTIKDDIHLFPSDALITQLRLLGGDK